MTLAAWAALCLASLWILAYHVAEADRRVRADRARILGGHWDDDEDGAA
jgi:hypothetical protein